MNPIFTRIFNILPEAYRNSSVIAGGAVVDLAKASDIDVFILGINDDKKHIDLAHALKPITGMCLSAPLDDDDGIEDIFSFGDEVTINSSGNTVNKVVGEIENPILGKIQIIAAPCMDVRSLLQGFDLSIHCFAVTPDGATHHIAESTPVTAPIKIVNPSIPDFTLVRYRKFCLRYGLKPDGSELAKLCAMPETAAAAKPKQRHLQKAYATS